MQTAATNRLRAVALLALAAILMVLTVADADAAVPQRFYGVATQGSFKPSDFPAMQNAGVGTARFLFGWRAAQTYPGPCDAGPYRPPNPHATPPDPGNTCDWQGMDAIVGSMAAAGVQPLPYVYGSAVFVASDTATVPLGSPTARAAWQDFLGAAVERYGRGGVYWSGDYRSQHPGSAPMPITRWQIWNEENSPYFFKPEPSPRRYAELLRLSAEAIRAQDPSASIMTGGMRDVSKQSAAMRLAPFLRALYRTGAAASFDTVGVHPYSDDIQGMVDQMTMVREEMKKAHDSQTGTWITEFGWSSGGPGDRRVVRTPAGQAKVLESAFRLLSERAARWHLGGINWYAWRDASAEESPCSWCPWSGLVAQDGTPKPALASFRKFTQPSG
jgi:hypothetical protein